MNKLVISVRLLPFENKVNKFSTKVSTHYRIIYQYLEEIYFDTFVSNNLFDFFWNLFNTKVIKVCHTIIICVKLSCY